MSIKKELTIGQEKYIHNLLQGMTQRQAYIKAYPKSAKWADATIDVRACALLETSKVKNRYLELRDNISKKLEEKTIWTREEAIIELKEVLAERKWEYNLVKSTYEKQVNELIEEMTQAKTVKKRKQIQENIFALNKKYRSNMAINSSILGAIDSLNKMQGYNKENISIIQDSDTIIRDKLAQLDVNELCKLLHD